MLSVLIVDDEPLAHQVLIHHLEDHPDCQLLGQCYSAVQALQWLANNSVDVVFLDINMPHLSGIDMLKVLANRPQVVIVSAHQDYALAGFELEVCDYLLKPVAKQRFDRALNKLRRAKQVTYGTNEDQCIVLKVDRELQKFKLAKISYFEGYGNYVKVWQGQEYTLASCTLKHIAEQLSDAHFTQIHKSYVVNNHQVKKVATDSVTMESEQQLRIGKTFRGTTAKILA